MTVAKVDPITITRLRLKCDAPECKHEELVNAVTPDLLDKPCPKCGTSLLTEQDYRDMLRIVAMYQGINAEIGPVDASDGPFDTYEINPHGGYVRLAKVKANRE